MLLSDHCDSLAGAKWISEKREGKEMRSMNREAGEEMEYLPK
jgi:hypothetical protein